MCKKYLPVGMKEAVTHCLDSFVPFYLYRLPEREGGRLGFGVSLSGRIERKTADFSVPGFVAAPFDSEEEVYFIPGEFECGGDLTDKAVRDLKDAVFSGIRMPCPESGDMDKEAYRTAFEEIMRRIDSGVLEKVVLSRTLTLKRGDSGFSDVFSYWELLRRAYPHAFVFLYFIPGKGVWAGASPELLLDYTKGRVKTMALAGTRPVSFEGELLKPWTQKEIREQGVVRDYIREVLENRCRSVDMSETHTFMAGNICHLCTDFTALTGDGLESLLKALHPTPALGGFPRKEALACIREVEVHKRKFYGGYLGPVGKDVARLYVNIRSMELFPGAFRLYVGGGINGDSVFEDEWEETSDKAATLLNVLGIHSVGDKANFNDNAR